MTRMTLEDAILAIGIDARRIDPAGYPCPCCHKVRPAWAMSAPAQGLELLGDVFCTDCFMDMQRVEDQMREIAEAGRLAEDDPWGADLGTFVRNERNRRIEQARWAIDPLTSPLSESNQHEFVQYIQSLNRLTLDFNSPNDVVWPEPPALEYP